MSDTATRVATGAGWLYGYRWLDRLLAFVSIVVLARILAPEDFGLVAIAASYVAIIEGLSDFDVNSALIRTRDEHSDLYDSAWTLSVLRGIVSALLMVGLAAFVADARISTLVYALAVSPILIGLSNPRFVMFERDLVYSRLAIVTLTARIASFSVTLFVAIVYRSYWALILGMLVNSLTSMVLTYVLKPYRPRFSVRRFADIFAFSGWMSLTTMVTTLSMQTDRIIVWRLIGIAEAGSYFMTQRVAAAPTAELIGPLRRILFPSFSEMVRDPARLRRAVCESIGILGSLSLPAAVGFALLANDFVPIVLGETWVPIVPLLLVLVPFLGFRATLSMALPCVMALGRTRLLFNVSVVYAFVHLPVFIAGAAAFGLPGAIWGIVVAGVFYSYLNAWMLRQTLGVTAGEILSQLRRPVSAVLVMIGAVLAVDATSPIDLFSPEGSWLSLAVKLGLGGGVFCAAQFLLWRFEGRPPGIEGRLLQLVSRSRPTS
jgi:PST family polysaccharide transporter